MISLGQRIVQSLEESHFHLVIPDCNWVTSYLLPDCPSSLGITSSVDIQDWQWTLCPSALCCSEAPNPREIEIPTSRLFEPVGRVPIFTCLNSGPYECPSVSPRPSLISTQVRMSAPVRAPDLHSSQLRSIRVPQCEPQTFTHLNSGPYECPSAGARPSLVSTQVCMSDPV